MAEKLKKKPKDKPPEQDSPWKTRITRMKKYQQKNFKDWERNKRLLFGETNLQDTKENLFSFGWGLVKSLETAIYVQNPEMAVEPYDGSKQSLGMSMGQLLTRIANYDIDQMDLKSIGNEGLIDCFINGFVPIIETIETEKSFVSDGKEDVERLEEQEFEARRIAPKDFLVDPKCRKLDLSDADYIAIATYPTIASIKADKESYQHVPSDIEDYPEASPEKPPVRQGENRPAPDATSGGGEKDPEYKTICIWEVHDKVHQEIIYVSDHKMQEMGRKDWPVKYKIGNRQLFAVTLMAFHKVPDQFWPKPEISLIAPQLENINRLDKGIIEDALEKWRLFVTYAGLLTSDQEAKVTELASSNRIIKIQPEDINTLASQAGIQQHQIPDVDHVLSPVVDPFVKKDQLAVREMLKQEIMDIVGYGPPDRAGMPRTRSAREAVAVKEKLEARLAKRADAVADFYRLFGQKHLMAVQQKAVGDRYVRVFDAAKGLTEYQKYSKEDIQSGTFNFIVYAGTSMPRNTEARKNSEIQLYSTLMPAMQAGAIPWQPPTLRLAEAFGWKGVNELLKNFKPAAVNMAKVMMKANAGKQIPPNAIPEAWAALMFALFSPEELQQLASEMQQDEAKGSQQPEKPPGQRGESDRSRMEVGGVS